MCSLQRTWILHVPVYGSCRTLQRYAVDDLPWRQHYLRGMAVSGIGVPGLVVDQTSSLTSFRDGVDGIFLFFLFLFFFFFILLKKRKTAA